MATSGRCIVASCVLSLWRLAASVSCAARASAVFQSRSSWALPARRRRRSFLARGRGATWGNLLLAGKAAGAGFFAVAEDDLMLAVGALGGRLRELGRGGLLGGELFALPSARRHRWLRVARGALRPSLGRVLAWRCFLPSRFFFLSWVPMVAFSCAKSAFLHYRNLRGHGCGEEETAIIIGSDARMSKVTPLPPLTQIEGGARRRRKAALALRFLPPGRAAGEVFAGV